MSNPSGCPILSLGELTVLPLQEDKNIGIIDSFSVVVAGMSLTTSSGTVALSSTDRRPGQRHANTIVPDDLWQQLATTFNVVNDTLFDIFVIACNIGSLPSSLDFQFGSAGGITISIPFSELALPLFNFNTGQQLMTESGKPAYHFGLVSDGEGYNILLGDTLLRSAYVVYDLNSAQVYIAQTKFDGKESDIVAVGAVGNVGAAQASGDGGGDGSGGSTSTSGYATETLKVSNTRPVLNTANGASVIALGTGALTTGVASVTRTGLNTAGLTGASSVVGFSRSTNAPNVAISSAYSAAAASASTSAKSGAAGSLKMEVGNGMGLRWMVGGVLEVVLAGWLGLVGA